MYRVTSQADYDALSWEDKLHYGAANPQSEYAKNELQRTQNVLHQNPTEQAKNWYAQQQYVNRGGSADNAILGNFDKVAYGWGTQPAVRPQLNSLGITDDRIGFSNGKVTVDEQDFMTPDSVAQGKSYATDETMGRALRGYNKANEIVPARQYIDSQNLGINVGWDGNTGQVMAGSVGIAPDYIQDGVAYIRKSKLDAALQQEKERTGLYTNQDILSQYDDKYGGQINSLLGRVANPAEFSYDPKSDPIYQAFERQWLNQAQKTYDDTIARVNSQSGGAPSLGALAAAWNLKEQAQDQLAGYQNQFREQAYQRYLDAYNQDMTALDTVRSLQADEFNRAYGVNRDTIADRQDERQWQSDNRYRNAQLEQMRFNLERDKLLQPYELKQMDQAIKSGELQLSYKAMDNFLKQMEVNSLGAYGNFNERRSPGGDPDDNDVKPLEVTAFDEVVSQISNIINEPGRAKQQGLMDALRYVIRNEKLTETELADILARPELFGATESELNGAWSRI